MIQIFKRNVNLRTIFILLQIEMNMGLMYFYFADRTNRMPFHGTKNYKIGWNNMIMFFFNHQIYFTILQKNNLIIKNNSRFQIPMQILDRMIPCQPNIRCQRIISQDFTFSFLLIFVLLTRCMELRFVILVYISFSELTSCALPDPYFVIRYSFLDKRDWISEKIT